MIACVNTYTVLFHFVFLWALIDFIQIKGEQLFWKEIFSANLHVRKLTTAEHVLTTTDKKILKTRFVWGYTNVSDQKLQATNGKKWNHKNLMNLF